MRGLAGSNALARAAGRAAALALAASVVCACGSEPAATGSPVVTATPMPWTPSPPPPVTPEPTAAPVSLPLAVVARYDDLRPNVTLDGLSSAVSAGTILIPCEVISLTLDAEALVPGPGTNCLPATQIADALMTPASSAASASPEGGLPPASLAGALPAGSLALLPPGLVEPQLKVLPIGEADLFGAPKHRSLPYPLQAVASPEIPGSAYEVADIRTLISTGDTCPDLGFSMLAVERKKGWDWTLSGGTATYAGFKTDTRFPSPGGKGWSVPIVRVGKSHGEVADLISDNDVSANDFECPMIPNWVQHYTGFVFTIDPRVAPLLADRGGVKVVTLGSNHITNAGYDGVRKTIDYLDAAGIKHTGAGRTLADALAPAVVDVRGISFAFVGWDDIHGSASATADHPGVAHMTDEYVCSSLQAARQVADVVIAMPQWGWPEYHNTITKAQIAQRAHMFECGADGILGSGTHWASWASISPGPRGPRFAIGSHGNFYFDQNWSQETMEGVVVEATFSGTRLVQFRLHPYVIAHEAQPNLLDPSGDGRYVMQRVWSVSEVR
jgi:hypothetical protein